MIEYFEDVKKIISKLFEIDADSIDEESYLSTDLNISELDLEDLIASIEDKYQIEIPQEEYLKFHQVADIVTYLYENVDQSWTISDTSKRHWH